MSSTRSSIRASAQTQRDEHAPKALRRMGDAVAQGPLVGDRSRLARYAGPLGAVRPLSATGRRDQDSGGPAPDAAVMAVSIWHRRTRTLFSTPGDPRNSCNLSA